MAVYNKWFFPRGSLAREGWESVVDGATPSWKYTGIHVAALDGGSVALPAADVERMVVPLAGGFRVDHQQLPDDVRASTLLEGRRGVFEGPTDVLYLGAGTAVTITGDGDGDGAGDGRVAVAEAATNIRRPSRYLARSEVPVEIRGGGRDTRQVHNFGTAGGLDAVALLACEVITPAGNWSSHPGHKHDEDLPGRESELEEIYYFEAAPARGGGAPAEADAFASFATYSSAAGEIETRALVRTGDIALVPYGYHGPAAAAPEYDLYYLNVMAGPGPERVWMFSDDPSQTWIRAGWEAAGPDPRLPYRRADETDG